MAKGKTWFEQNVRKFCVAQVALLTAILTAVVACKFLFFPECRVNGRMLSAAILFFFLLAVMNFLLYAFGKARMNAGYVFGLVMLLTLVFVWRLPAGGGWFVGQMALFAVGEWLFDTFYYRRLR